MLWVAANSFIYSVFDAECLPRTFPLRRERQKQRRAWVSGISLSLLLLAFSSNRPNLFLHINFFPSTLGSAPRLALTLAREWLCLETPRSMGVHNSKPSFRTRVAPRNTEQRPMKLWRIYRLVLREPGTSSSSISTVITMSVIRRIYTRSGLSRRGRV